MEQPEQQPGDVRAMLTQLRTDRNAATDATGKRGDEANTAEEAWERRRGMGAAEDAPYDPPKTPRKVNMDVVVRVRPLSDIELQRRDRSVFRFPGNGNISAEGRYGQPFTFSVVFEPEANQDDVFEHSGVKRLVSLALDGFTCTCLAYGQTGSGKTHTLLGPDLLYNLSNQPDGFASARSRFDTSDRSAGVVPRALSFLMKQLNQNRAAKTTFKIQACFVEIYKERIRDLLMLNSMHRPQVRFRKDVGFYLENVLKVQCKTQDDLLAVLEEGVRSRHVGATYANDTSTRGHAILIVEIDTETVLADKLPNGNPGGRPGAQNSDELVIHRRGKITFVDLAGSEKLSTKTAPSVAENGDKTHYLETNTINKSLLVLGNCISALSDPRKRNGHIPFRDSNLTKLLCDSLGGNGYTLMIACITPASSCASESINTLRYAQRAKNIKNQPQVVVTPREGQHTDLRQEVRALRKENYMLREQLGQAQSHQTVATDEKFDSMADADRSKTPIDAPRSLPRPVGLAPSHLQPLYYPQNHSLRPIPTGFSRYPGTTEHRRSSRRDPTLHRNQQFARGFSDRFRQSHRLPPLQSDGDSTVYSILQEYVMENEMLRRENNDMLRAHSRCAHDQDLLYQQNERLQHQYEELQRSLSNSIVDGRSPVDHRRGQYVSPHRLPPAYNYAAPPPPRGIASGPIIDYDVDYDFSGANVIAFRKPKPRFMARQRRKDNFAVPSSTAFHFNGPPPSYAETS